MGVHAQGESGFFDEDTEVSLVHNEAVHQQHEPAADDATTVGKPFHSSFTYLKIKWAIQSHLLISRHFRCIPTYPTLLVNTCKHEPDCSRTIT